MLIEVEGVSKRFGGLRALDDVSLTARSGEVTAVIGPNGAGKSTLLDCLSGLTQLDSGRIVVNGRQIGAPRPGNLIEIGIARSFQHIRLFPNLTVQEQIILARRGYLGSRRARQEQANRDIPPVLSQLLSRVGLAHKAALFPNELSYGERRRLEIARALATNPMLLLVDEPAAGSNLSEQVRLAALITEIVGTGVAVILVEHHMDFIADVSTRVVVLNFGRVIVTGTIGEVRQNAEVISVYLGTSPQ